MGISGAIQALLTPNMGRYGFPHYLFFQFFISHGSIIIAAVYMSVVEGYRPYPRSFARVAIICIFYTLCVGFVNAMIGSNYLFIARKPETASALDLFPPWPWYIPVMVVGIAVSMLLLYLPFAWQDWKIQRLARQQVS